MAYSYVRYTGNGTTQNYTFSFPYINQDHIKVRVNGVITTAWSLLSSSTVQFTAAPASGAILEIRRETPKDSAIVNFTDGSVLLERDLDLLATYDLYLAQETKDGLDSSITQTALGVFDGQSKRITNVADPVDAQDAVTKNWVQVTYTAAIDATAAASAASALSSANSSAASAASAGAAAASETSALSYKNAAQASAVATAASVAQAVDGQKQLFIAGSNYTKNVTTQLTLTYSPAKSGTVKVFFDGVFQNLTEWSLVGNVVTFTAAIPADAVEILYDIPSQFVGLSTADLQVLGTAQSSAQSSATIAISQAGTATAAKTAAESARDAALIQSGVYATEALGRAAVADGVAFKVQGSGDVAAFEYRRTNSTTSVLLASYPSLSALTSIFDKDRIVLSANLLDKDDLTFESTSYLSDAISVSGNQNCTNFIKVTPGKQYYFRQQASYRRAILGFTDKTNASIVGRVGLPSTFGNYTFTMPANINYVKVGLVASGETRDTALFAQFSLSLGDWLAASNLTYSGYYANKTGSALPFKVKTGILSEVVSSIPATTNLLDYSKIITGLAVNASGYSSLSAASGWSVSPLISCAANDVFTFSGIFDVFERRVIYYDVNGTPVSGASISGATYKNFPGSASTERYLTITVPNTASIVAFRLTVHSSDTSYTDRSGSYHIYKGTGYKPFLPYRAAEVLDGVEYFPKKATVDEYVAPLFRRPTSFADKHIAVIGDSITSNAVWVSRFAKIVRPSIISNYSTGGMRLVSTAGSVNPASLQNAGPDKAYQMAQDITNSVISAPDYVLIFLGANEFAKTPDTTVVEANIDDAFAQGGTTLLALSSVDITKIPGALRYMVETIGQVAPSTKFLIVTPIPNTLHPWATQRNVGDTIKYTARRMSIPCIDLQANSNILTLWDYPAGVSTYRNLVDGIHPFGSGVTETPATKMIAEQVASEFLNYVIVST